MNEWAKALQGPLGWAIVIAVGAFAVYELTRQASLGIQALGQEITDATNNIVDSIPGARQLNDLLGGTEE